MQVSEIMRGHPVTITELDTAARAAQLMRQHNVGLLPVTANASAGKLIGIITDRDIVVRAVAAGMPLDRTRAGDICSGDLIQVDENASVEECVAIMREHAIRRVPVVDGDKPIGIVSIGDLARCKDPGSALAEISAAVPNN